MANENWKSRWTVLRRNYTKAKTWLLKWTTKHRITLNKCTIFWKACEPCYNPTFFVLLHYKWGFDEARASICKLEKAKTDVFSIALQRELCFLLAHFRPFLFLLLQMSSLFCKLATQSKWKFKLGAFICWHATSGARNISRSFIMYFVPVEKWRHLLNKNDPLYLAHFAVALGVAMLYKVFWPQYFCRCTR